MVKKLLQRPARALASRAGIPTLGSLRTRSLRAGSQALFGLGALAFALPVGNRNEATQPMHVASAAPATALQSSAGTTLSTIDPAALVGGNPLESLTPFTTIHIVGPWSIPPNTSCTWTPDIPGVSGPPYAGTVRWYVDGNLVSPVWSATWSATSNFTLTLDVWDANDVFLGEEYRVVQINQLATC